MRPLHHATFVLIHVGPALVLVFIGWEPALIFICSVCGLHLGALLDDRRLRER